MPLHIDARTTSYQPGETQQSEPLNRTLPGEVGAARPQGSHELSGLTAAPSRKPSLPQSADPPAIKRSADDINEAMEQPAKRMRLNAALPPRAEHPASAMPAHASQIGAISSHAAGAPQLGGKVIDIPDLPVHSKVPTTEQARQIESKIKNALKDQHGPVEVFGYHVTTQENADAIRNQGFSANANTGQGGGIAGMNIHGSGLYTSRRPADDYLKPNKTNVMYAVVVPQSAGFKQGTGKTGKSWDAASNAATAHDGDFVNSMSGDRKVNPGAISKVGLVPVATIPPSMSPELLAMQPGASNKRVPPKTVSPELHNWISGAVEKHSDAVQAISDEPDPDKKLDLINDLRSKIVADGGMHEDADNRLLMMDLKSRYQ